MKHAWIQTPEGSHLGAVATHPLQSATWNLISALHAGFPETAKRLLRLPIHLDHEPGLVCKETLKVAAKRFGEPGPAPSTLQLLPTPHGEQLSSLPTDALPLEESHPLSFWVDQMRREKTPDPAIKRYQRHRPVWAYLLQPQENSQYCLKARARNTNALIKNHHAEANLALEWFNKIGGKIPTGWMVLVSLQPCRMCSAILSVLSTGLTIRYLEVDPGPMAKICWVRDSAQIHG